MYDLLRRHGSWTRQGRSLIRRWALVLTAAVCWSALVAGAQTTAPASGPDKWACPEEMHEAFVARFESAPGFGFARVPTTLRLNRSGTLVRDEASYAVVDLELIGGLDRDEPVAYVTRGHGPGPLVPDARSRALTAWESRNLGTIRDGGEIRCGAGDDPSQLQCLGPLRAKPGCLECHQGREVGDVLGALSYRLHASPPVR